MERIEQKEPNRTSLKRDSIFLSGLFSVLPLLLGTSAYARPEAIQPPPKTPPAGESPGTKQPPPSEPDDPPPIPPPTKVDCIEGADQSDCDADHPGNPVGARPSNKPAPAWYNDMASRMYEMQQALEEVSEYGYRHDYNTYYLATWLMSVTQQYYARGYESNGAPREYSYGKMTRGDFNYYYYYWVRPIYYSLLDVTHEYHRRHPRDSAYKAKLYNLYSSYRPLVACNYGFDGDDTGAREDLETKMLEIP